MVPRCRPAHHLALLATVTMTLLTATVGSAGAQTATAERQLDIVVPMMGNWSAGTATLGVAYEGSTATVHVRAPEVALGPGKRYRLTTCAKASTLYVGYDNRCERREVDQRAATDVATFAAPVATATVTRPVKDGRQGYAQALVLVEEARTSGWVAVAGTPTTSLAASALALTSSGGVAAPLPATGGLVFVSGSDRVGGIDSGYPDSFCGGAPDDTATAAPAGVTVGALGADAPAYHEVGAPTGTYEGKPARGVMLLVHGGGWSAVGAQRAITMRAEADRWRARGWRTVLLSYRACAQSLPDVLWFHDRAVERYGAGLPLCLSGGSAGGQLALATAVWRATVACVVANGAPTDGTTIGNERAFDPANPTGPGQVDGPRWVGNMMAAAWGLDQLAWHSPARWPIRARVLVATAEQDSFVPWTQATGLRDRMLANDPAAYVDAYRVPKGTSPYVHANVSSAGLRELHRREAKLIAGLGG